MFSSTANLLTAARACCTAPNQAVTDWQAQHLFLLPTPHTHTLDLPADASTLLGCRAWSCMSEFGRAEVCRPLCRSVEVRHVQDLPALRLGRVASAQVK